VPAEFLLLAVLKSVRACSSFLCFCFQAKLTLSENNHAKCLSNYY
jgi:hypothetical protein